MIGDAVPQKKREVLVAQVTSLVESEYFFGPIPHPKHFEAYERIAPGTADRIITMAEKQQDHHIDMENKKLDAKESHSKLGMWFGIIGFLALIASALVVALWTESTTITVLFLAPAALGGVSLFIRGRRSEKQ